MAGKEEGMRFFQIGRGRRPKVCDGEIVPRRSLGMYWDGCWQDGGRLGPPSSGYGEDGVHSREAAGKKTEERKLMRENNKKKRVGGCEMERKSSPVGKRLRKIINGKKEKNKWKT